jgi:3-methyladenine DNA glycosylase/8-oxoguanine DNA glycosylase
MKKILLNVPEDFSFKSTVYSHGWADLLPFGINKSPFSLSYCIYTQSNNVFPIKISSPDDRQLKIEVLTDSSKSEKNFIFLTIRRMFRLDEDYSEFYAMAEISEKFTWVNKYRAGRMLRCGSLWEDMVKMLCTTNCTWRLTQIMTENLVQKLGKAVEIIGNKVNSFPDPVTIASKSEDYLRNEIKMGYRAPYLLDFAKRIINNKISLLDFEKSEISTQDLYKQLKNIKGFGDYAVSNLLKLLGRYDYLGADSWSRQKFIDKYNNGKKCDDKRIEKFYNNFGTWAGLFFWMDVSEDWYRYEKPW